MDERDNICARCCCCPHRFIVAFLAGLSILLAYVSRVCLSLALTKMVKHKAVVINETTVIRHCGESEGPKEHKAEGEFDWSEKEQGYVLSAFFVGYLVTQIPAAVVAEKFGAKMVLQGGLLMNAGCVMSVPYVVRTFGIGGMILVRTLQGCGQGVVFPVATVILVHWIPKKERAIVGSCVFAGCLMGTVIGNYGAGLILSHFDWSAVFYAGGIVCVIWYIFSIFFLYSYPDTHPCLTSKERNFLKESIRHDAKPAKFPWGRMLKNVPVWAMVSAQVGHDWAFFMMITDMPKYFNDVLHPTSKQNGLYNSYPYIAMWVSAFLSGFVGHAMIDYNITSEIFERKFMTAFSAYLPAIFMMGISYSGTNCDMAIICFVLAMMTMGAFYAGVKLTPLDLAPNYAGTLAAFANGIASLSGVVAPVVAGWLTPNQTIEEWRNVFWVSFVFISITTGVYCIWASSEVQSFNAAGDEK